MHALSWESMARLSSKLVRDLLQPGFLSGLTCAMADNSLNPPADAHTFTCAFQALFASMWTLTSTLHTTTYPLLFILLKVGDGGIGRACHSA